MERTNLDKSTEAWAVIGHHPRYEISSMGNIRARQDVSVNAQCVVTSVSLTPSPITPTVRKDGYCGVILANSGKRTNFNVHTLVAEAFCPRRPGDRLVRHLDGVGSNNRAVNLAWGTAKENYADMVRHGTRVLRGART